MTITSISKYAPLIVEIKSILLERYVLSKDEIFSLLTEISNRNLNDLISFHTTEHFQNNT